MRRFGVIGDVHAEDSFLAAALEHLANQRVDHVLCVGDLTDGRGDVDRCVDLLRHHQVATVRGNHDRWMLADEMRELPHATMRADITPSTREYLRNLPITKRFDSPAGGVLLCHGLGDDDMVFVDQILAMEDPTWRRRERGRLLRLVPKDVSIVVAGHTHRRKVRRLGRVTIIDAGTLRDNDNPGFVVVDLEKRRVQCYDLVSDGTIVEAEELEIRP